MLTKTIITIAPAAVLAATACTTQTVPVLQPEKPQVPSTFHEYADCWADAATQEKAQPPTSTFNSLNLAQLRCRHLEPGPDYYLDKHVWRAGFKMPRYTYTTEIHAECLATVNQWFKNRHPQAGADHPQLFAETACAVPPPAYTNVED